MAPVSAPVTAGLQERNAPGGAPVNQVNASQSSNRSILTVSVVLNGVCTLSLLFTGAGAASSSELGPEARPVTPVTPVTSLPSPMAMARTPCNPPPPLHASTAILSETQQKRNKKKLFTEKVGIQEI